MCSISDRNWNPEQSFVTGASIEIASLFYSDKHMNIIIKHTSETGMCNWAEVDGAHCPQ